jgi:DNA-binding XRE family transcriptional regulator
MLPAITSLHWVWVNDNFIINSYIRDNNLAEVRMLMKKTQNDMAKALGVKQPTIAKMEKSGRDVKLSSLKRYIEAGGGKVRLDIELPDGQHHGFEI